MNDGGSIAVSPHSSDVVFCTGNVYPNSVWNIGISHTSNGGLNWEHDTIPLGSNGFAVAYDPFDANRVYVAGDSAYNYSYPQFLITTDLGSTWTSSHAGMTGRVWTVAADPDQSGVLYCGTYQGIFKSLDGGASWASTGFTRDTRTMVIDAENGIIYAGTYSYGVYMSNDYGANWVAMNTGLTNTKILSLDLRSGSEVTLFAGTEGGSVFRTTLASGIASPGTPARGSQFAFSVSPNPCHAATTVRFSSSLTARATVALYDASGRIVNSWMPTTSSFTMNTEHLTPGAYFVRLADGARTRTARLTVLE
jgi:hypothetical protein